MVVLVTFGSQWRERTFEIAKPNVRVNGINMEEYAEEEEEQGEEQEHVGIILCTLTPVTQNSSHTTKCWIAAFGHTSRRTWPGNIH